MICPNNRTIRPQMNPSNNSRQALWVAIGQFFAYTIGIVSPMILSRYFNKSDYGTYKQVMYVYNSLLLVFTLGLPKAYSYFIPRVSLGQSKDVIRKISRIFMILGIIFSALLFFCSSFIANILKNPDLELALKWFAPTPLLLLPTMGLEGILASYKKTEYIAFFTILSRMFMLLCIVFPVIALQGTYIHALIGFDVASLLTYILSIHLRNLPTKNITREKTEIKCSEIFTFSLPLLTASFWIMIFQSVNQFFVSRYFGNEVFAEFSNGFMEFPINQMIVASVATVLMPLFSGMAVYNREDIGSVWIGALTKSVKLLYPITIYCILFAPVVMTCFYGSMYKNSAIYFAIKNIESFFTIIPFYPILLALGKTKKYSNVHMIFAFIIVPLEYLVIRLGGAAYMIGIMCVVCVIGKVILQFSIVSKSVNMSFKELIPIIQMFKISMQSVIAAILPFIFVTQFQDKNEWFLLFISLLFYVLLFYALCWIFHLTYKDIIKSLIGNRAKKIIKYIP